MTSARRNRRFVSALALAALLAASVVACGCGPRARVEPGRESRPNILLIVIDALRADRLECYGYQRQTSPNLNALASEGVLFSNAMAPGPETVLSIPSLLTGRRPREHGVLWIQRGKQVYAGPGLRLPTLAEMLGQNGYVTAAVSANPLVGAGTGVNRGFDTFDQSTGRVSVWQHLSGADVNASAYKWLDTYRPESGPFFLYLHYIDPHNLYRPPSAFCIFGRPGYTPKDNEVNEAVNDVFDAHVDPPVTGATLAKHGLTRRDVERMSDLYDGEVLCADHYVGELLERLRQSGLYENTIVIVTADHGESFLDHGNLEHGGSLYQELIHVPLIIRLPGVRGSQEVDELVESIDLAPTILEAAGITSRAVMSGRSFYQPLTTGQPIPAEVGMSELPARKMYAVRSGDWKLIESPAKTELYDLSRDPLETRDLAPERPDQVSHLKRELQDLLRKHPPAKEGTEPVDQTELDALKALGYIK